MRREYWVSSTGCSEGNRICWLLRKILWSSISSAKSQIEQNDGAETVRKLKIGGGGTLQYDFDQLHWKTTPILCGVRQLGNSDSLEYRVQVDRIILETMMSYSAQIEQTRAKAGRRSLTRWATENFRLSIFKRIITRWNPRTEWGGIIVARLLRRETKTISTDSSSASCL